MKPQFAILNPCSKRWADLTGEGRGRFCETCRTPVHSIEDYSEAEWAQVWQSSGGRVCGLLGGESAPEPRSRRAVLVGALLTALSPLMAQTGRVRIRVTDPTGTVVPEAPVSLMGSDDKPVRTATTDVLGEVVFMGLPLGDNRLTITVPGFRTRRITVTVRGSEEMRVEATLDVGLVGEFVTVTTPLGHQPIGTQLDPVSVPPEPPNSQAGPDSHAAEPVNLEPKPVEAQATQVHKRSWWRRLIFW